MAHALAALVEDLHWIPEGLCEPDPNTYRRELLYEDPDGLFSLSCFTWLPGQATPIHDHTAWGAIGVAQGALRSTFYHCSDEGQIRKSAIEEYLHVGAVTAIDPLDPRYPDLHRIGSASALPTISLHLYGCPLSEIIRQRYPDPE
jgi:predicted metal-dependent enzyme (double-stranded beta helix superfamily)